MSDPNPITDAFADAMTPEMLAAVIRRQVKIAIDSTSDPKHASAAAATILKAVAQVQQDEQRAAKQHVEIINRDKPAKDLNLISRAITNDWSIPSDVMDDLPEILADVARTGDARARVAAARVLVAMNAQNRKTNPSPTVSRHRVLDINPNLPATEEEFAERKRAALARIARIGDDTSGLAAG